MKTSFTEESHFNKELKKKKYPGVVAKLVVKSLMQA